MLLSIPEAVNRSSGGSPTCWSPSGFVIENRSDAYFLPVNDADNWLHLLLTAGLLAGGLVAVLTERRAVASTA